MEDNFSVLNKFLVEVFNEILKVEEQSITGSQFKDLSVRELHVIEAVCLAEENGSGNKAADIAESLGVTAGTLTTAVSFLERKEYLVRKRDQRDRRIVRIQATKRGHAANELHKEFHKQIVDNVLIALDEEEKPVFLRALNSISEFFEQNKRKKEK